MSSFNYAYKTPAATATGLIFFRKNERIHIVLAKRGDNVDAYPGMYCLPGGFLEVGRERLCEAMAREAREELNVYSDSDDWVLFHVQDTFADIDPRNEHTINSCFYLDIDEFAYGYERAIETLVAGDDIGDYLIVPLDTAIHMKLAFDHSIILQAFCAFATRPRLF